MLDRLGARTASRQEDGQVVVHLRVRRIDLHGAAQVLLGLRGAPRFGEEHPGACLEFRGARHRRNVRRRQGEVVLPVGEAGERTRRARGHDDGGDGANADAARSRSRRFTPSRDQRGAEMADGKTESERRDVREALGHDRARREHKVGRGKKEHGPEQRSESDGAAVPPPPRRREKKRRQERPSGERARIGEGARDRHRVERVVRHEMDGRDASERVLELDPSGRCQPRPRACGPGRVVERDRRLRSLVGAQCDEPQCQHRAKRRRIAGRDRPTSRSARALAERVVGEEQGRRENRGLFGEDGREVGERGDDVPPPGPGRRLARPPVREPRGEHEKRREQLGPPGDVRDDFRVDRKDREQ